MNLTELRRPDGCVLRGATWPAREARQHALIVHGLGEHCMRYARLAQWLNGHGISVHAFDHRGHGKSDGPRGALHADDDLLQDACAALDFAAAQATADGRYDVAKRPPLIIGHSMGGLVVARLITARLRPVQAAILSSPALDLGLNPVQRLLLGVLPKIAPNLAINNGLDASKISHDPEAVARYKSDPLVHGKVTGRLVNWMAQAVGETQASAANSNVPTLLMFAGADALVKPQGSRRFAKAAPAALLTTHEVQGAYHELFNEAEPWRSQVFEHLGAWLPGQLK